MPLRSGKLAIGLLGVEDPADVRSYSGTPFHLGHFLRRAGNEVRILGPYPLRHRALVRVQNKLLRMFTRRELLWERHRLIASQYPEIVRSYVDQNPDLDLLLATSLFYGAKARTRVPLILWADTSVAGLMGKYPRYRSLSKRTRLRSHAVEQDALTACDLAIFSNQWAADLALATYNLSPGKVRVIRYGANLVEAPDQRKLARMLALRRPEQMKLISIGVDWQRKGMAKAIEISSELRRRGLNVQLQIVGCRPPRGLSIPPHVTLVGPVSKGTPGGAKQMEELLGASHLLILPTEAECAAVVLAEASAYGVPSITTEVGGNSSLVQQNVNGILLPPQADLAVWADTAVSILDDRNGYERFVWRSNDFFHQHLSWERSISAFARAAHQLLGTSGVGEQPAALVSSVGQAGNGRRL